MRPFFTRQQSEIGLRLTRLVLTLSCPSPIESWTPLGRGQPAHRALDGCFASLTKPASSARSFCACVSICPSPGFCFFCFDFRSRSPLRSSSPPIVCLRKCVMVAAADFYLFIYCLFLLGNAAILIGCLKILCSVLVCRRVGYEAKKASQYFVFEFIMT